MKNFGCVAAALFLFSSYLDADDEAVLTADSPERLRTLVEGYERERARVLDPLERKFDEALLDLQRQFTKAGRLEDAVAVAAIIEARTNDQDSGPHWKDTRWKWGSGGILELKRNGDTTHTEWSRPGEWEERDDGTLKLVSQHGGSTIKFTDEKSGTVTSVKSGGRTTLTLIE